MHKNLPVANVIQTKSYSFIYQNLLIFYVFEQRLVTQTVDKSLNKNFTQAFLLLF